MDKTKYLAHADFVALKAQQLALYQDQVAKLQAQETKYLWLVCLSTLMALVPPVLFVLILLLATDPGQFYEHLVGLLVATVTLSPASGLASYLFFKQMSDRIRSHQLLTQLEQSVAKALEQPEDHEHLQDAVRTIEQRFLANDDELLVKKYLWDRFMEHEKQQLWETIVYYRLKAASPQDKSITMHHIPVPPLEIPIVWNTKVQAFTGSRGNNLLHAEAEIHQMFIQTQRGGLGTVTSAQPNVVGLAKLYKMETLLKAYDIAAQNPVLLDKFMRYRKVSKALKLFMQRASVHLMTPAGKMRLMTFVDTVLKLDPRPMDHRTLELLREKDAQIDNYTDDFWQIHRQSIRFYVYEVLLVLGAGIGVVVAIWLSQLGHLSLGFILGLLTAMLLTTGETYLITLQRTKIKGKKLMPVLVAGLMSVRHELNTSQIPDDHVEAHMARYQRKFKRKEKHFIQTTNELNAVRNTKFNLRDGISHAHLTPEQAQIYDDADERAERYYELARRARTKSDNYGGLEAFPFVLLIIMWLLYPGFGAWWIPGTAAVVLSIGGIYLFHLQAIQVKDFYMKLYQAMSLLAIDKGIRTNPTKLNDLFTQIEHDGLEIASSDQWLLGQVHQLSHISGVKLANPGRLSTHYAQLLKEAEAYHAQELAFVRESVCQRFVSRETLNQRQPHDQQWRGTQN